MTRIGRKKALVWGQDDEFDLGRVEFVLPQGGQIGEVCQAAGNVICCREMLVFSAQPE